MVRSDPPLYAAADPPTVKTEPPGAAADDAREPASSVSATEDAGAGADQASEHAEATPDPRNVDDEVAITADAAPEPPAVHPQSEVADGPPSDVEPQRASEAQPAPVQLEPVQAAPVQPTPLPPASDAVQPEPEPPRPDRLAIEGEAARDAFAAAAAEPAPAPPAEAAAPLTGPNSGTEADIESPIAAAASQARPLADAISAPAHAHPRPLLADWDRERVKSVSVRTLKVAAIVFSAWFTVVLFLIAVYRFVNPPFSSLMVMQWLGGTSIHREWVPVEKISPNLVRAVIASEDGRFCSHWGIDFGELAAAIKRTSRGTPRGGSTITMQVAKNLFLWPAKSYVRKVIEVPLTYAIELMWPKWRIMEVYLNIAEWGPGVFGAEAAAREHFGRSAARLSSRQGALLAVALPNPFVRDAGDPGPWASRRSSVIQRRAGRSPEAATCVLGGD